ncbi:DoxX family protein [Schumannella sp. 10F1B-5-1]|uniref:DoxX family protein n=1 Tax=Schumannella sp. 10F1B-5-1 TaxID=2590780 RepID=UPI00113170C3|nr:DoxX family protein [Schumannella sp. 10F1B-5-1]TPW73762.1 DoxX family protein [Schumannella sp. 10F1B-5-1]
MRIGSLILRLVVGGVFVGHGLQKLTGAFDGPGLDGVESMMEKTGMTPAARNARAVALTETAGGAAIALGVATPVAAGGLISTMLVAIDKVHWRNGFWNTKGGWEFNAVLIAALAAIVADGPGRVSADAAFGRRRWGPLGALAAAGIGVAGAVGAVQLAKRAAAEAEGDHGAFSTASDDAGSGREPAL